MYFRHRPGLVPSSSRSQTWAKKGLQQFKRIFPSKCVAGSTGLQATCDNKPILKTESEDIWRVWGGTKLPFVTGELQIVWKGNLKPKPIQQINSNESEAAKPPLQTQQNSKNPNSFFVFQIAFFLGSYSRLQTHVVRYCEGFRSYSKILKYLIPLLFPSTKEARFTRTPWHVSCCTSPKIQQPSTKNYYKILSIASIRGGVVARVVILWPSLFVQGVTGDPGAPGSGELGLREGHTTYDSVG